MDRLLHSREETATLLSVSVSTVDVMIARGLLRARRQGRRVLVPRAEIERAAKRDTAVIWPKKRDGKTTRYISVVSRRSEDNPASVPLSSTSVPHPA